MSRTAFCPHCRSVTALEELQNGDLTKSVCQRCGGPLEVKLGRKDAAASLPATVLYIDDDRLLLSMFCDALEEQGYRTLIATDGPSGIETARNGRPDLILLDVLMPGMTGIEVCRRLRADPELQGTPIILLTAMADLSVDAEGKSAGATLTVRKPFGPALIVSTIREILGRKTDPPKP